jgi:hypothetical protein
MPELEGMTAFPSGKRAIDQCTCGHERSEHLLSGDSCIHYECSHPKCTCKNFMPMPYLVMVDHKLTLVSEQSSGGCSVEADRGHASDPHARPAPVASAELSREGSPTPAVESGDTSHREVWMDDLTSRIKHGWIVEFSNFGFFVRRRDGLRSYVSNDQYGITWGFTSDPEDGRL